MKKSNYWYVIVCTTEGAKFVTSTERKYAHWDENEKPLEMSKEMAQDIALGLALNFYCAFAVCNPFEVDQQPYRYDFGHFEWVENKDK